MTAPWSGRSMSRMYKTKRLIRTPLSMKRKKGGNGNHDEHQMGKKSVRHRKPPGKKGGEHIESTAFPAGRGKG